MQNSELKVFAIYDADGSLRGELAYMLGKVSGTRECALCDISHGWNPLGKREWRDAQQGTTPVTWLHRDEQPPAMRDFTAGRLPAVVLSHADGHQMLMEKSELEGCRGDYASFERTLNQRLTDAGITPNLVSGDCDPVSV
jgi:hypothetical protein